MLKWAAGILLVLALIVGATYAVGRFQIANDMEITRSVVIDRPRATLFALASDMRIVQRWSPYYARDPSAEYSFSDDELGEGQSMFWTGGGGLVGQGTLTTAQTAAPTEVNYVLDVAERAQFNVKLTFAREGAPQDGRTRVEMSVYTQCRDTALNVPCRYVNLMVQRSIEQDIDAALARLKGMAENDRMPRADFEGLEVEFHTLSPRNFLYVEPEVSLAVASNDRARTRGEIADLRAQRVSRAMRDARATVEAAMARNGLTPIGPLLRITTDWAPNERIAFQLGYRFDGPPPDVRVSERIGQTPSGRVMRVVHDGPYANLPDTYAKARAYLCAHAIYRCDEQLERQDLPWEEVLSEASDPDGRTRVAIYFPLQ